jgi:hypothetical protein
LHINACTNTVLPVDNEKHPVDNILLFREPLLHVRHYTESLLYGWVWHVYQIVQGLIHALLLVLQNCPVFWCDLWRLSILYQPQRHSRIGTLSKTSRTSSSMTTNVVFISTVLDTLMRFDKDGVPNGLCRFEAEGTTTRLLVNGGPEGTVASTPGV